MCILAMQRALALGTASWQMHQAQENLPADVTLICSGNTMKWVSISQSDELGQFVFVDPSTFIDDDVPQVDCTSKVQGDLQAFALHKAVYETTSLVSYRALVQRLFARPYTSFAYLKAFVRGPPIRS